MFHVETFGDPVGAIEPEREAGASHRLRGPGKGWSKVDARSELSADNSDPSSYSWWPGRRRLRPMPLTALFRRRDGKGHKSDRHPVSEPNPGISACPGSPENNSPGVRRTEAGPRKSPRRLLYVGARKVGSCQLEAINSLSWTIGVRLDRCRPRSSPTDPSKRRHHISKIAIRAPQFVTGQTIKFVTFCLRSWIFRSSCLCFENTANELPAATPATSAWTRRLAANARLPVRIFERPAALQKTSGQTEQLEHPAGALTASFPVLGRRRRSSELAAANFLNSTDPAALTGPLRPSDL